MEIRGQSLSIPRNFFFLNRLPARFEILVVGRGVTSAKGTAFELEIQGQRLMLHSKVDLKPGARYELEKISALEFRILTEKLEEKKEPAAEIREAAARAKPSETEAAAYLQAQSDANSTDVLALKVLADSGRKIEAKADKYLFNLEAEFPVRGVFVPQAGGFSLFVSSLGLNAGDIENLRHALSPIGIQNIRSVTPAVLERISAGAVDIQS